MPEGLASVHSNLRTCPWFAIGEVVGKKFGRFAAKDAAAKGEKPETFDFLGFTHYCSTRRDGTGFRVKRVTANKKFIAKLAAFKEWLKKSRTMKTAVYGLIPKPS